MMEGKPVIADAFFDVLLSDVKNERRQDEQGVVTLTEIAADMGFENRSEVWGEAVKTQSPLEGIVRGRYSRCFIPCVISFRSRTIKTAFLLDTGGTCTFIGKPTWDKLLEGFEDVGANTVRVTLNGETRQEVTLSPQDRHFADIDVIGTDFLNHMEARVHVDYKRKTCVLEWDEP
eukprot:CAMPEP_0117042482 /NCGR_PEP_ID=MMETSP0472-20121206/29582_1 /TAXON_ID=693140 ORGANISM="Tiarina fusus, Strain LIS" /NCGR_SAMPLE_ID=MMETSP0472 /ASSEMBLY_ACC=CAM_ASM_000603 /LENGTH=174 /DNA_ID=CAMNT_0004753735 /DNA_START=45 /DNA_END=569 /DNA_ORIENTATION=+